MCGLFGVATSEGRRDEHSRKMAFRQGLQVQEWRGDDATGVGLVKAKSMTSNATVLKRAMAASDFVRWAPYTKMVENRFDEYGLILGHARSATSGRGMADQDNDAHPFQEGPVTLTHNGHVRNCHLLDHGDTDSFVDSSRVAGALSRVTEPEKVLTRLEGAYVLVWHDARDGSLNFARNAERPLFWCYVEKENTMFWGSELELMYGVLKRNGIKIEGKFKHCTSHVHFKFDLKNLREVVPVPFVHRTPVMSTGGSGTHWKGNTRHLPAQATSRAGTGSTAPTSGSATRPDAPMVALLQERTETPLIRTIVTELAEELEKEEPTPTGDRRDRPTRPTSRKKMRRATQALFQMGRKLDQPVCFTPCMFYPYPNQDPPRGAIRGYINKVNFEIGNVPEALWHATKRKKIYGRISNVHISKDKIKIIICDFAPDLQERFITRYTTLAKADAEDTKRDIAAGIILDREDIDTLEGPLGRLIPIDEWIELTARGCSNCNEAIEVSHNPKVLWCGTGGQYPVCENCSNDPQIQAMFGSIQ